jgi:hypothetical protein
MAQSEHNREAYRLLFGYVGAGLQLFALLMIMISFPVAPTIVVVGLGVALVALGIWSWRVYRTNFMMPTFVGTAMAGAWMLVVGLGAMAFGWGP